MTHLLLHILTPFAAPYLQPFSPRQSHVTVTYLPGDTTVALPGSIQATLDDPESGGTIFFYDDIYDAEDAIYIASGKTLQGESAEDTVMKACIIFDEANAALETLTLEYPEGEYVSFTSGDEAYQDLTFLADAGITASDSDITVRNCIIMPDLDRINAAGDYNPPLTQYGKGIQILNLGDENINLNIDNNLILKGEAGIYIFSQESGGAASGAIKNNTLYLNNYGIFMRMHQGSPGIENNIITRSYSAIHLTYDSLLEERLAAMANNCIYFNRNKVWCDAESSAYDPTGPDNIFEYPDYERPYYWPDYVYPTQLNYTPQNQNCADKGFRLP